MKDKTGAEDEVYIGRGSIWGNPFSHQASKFPVIRVASRSEAISRFEGYIRNERYLLAAIPSLVDKTLVCFCAPEACHGDVLVTLVEEYEKGIV